MNDLEVVTTEVKGAEPTSKKGVEPTEPKAEPTVGIEGTEVFRHALDKALGKSTESLQRQVTLSKQAESTAKADAEKYKTSIASIEAELKDLQRQHEELVISQADDPDAARKAYVDRRTIADERRKLATDKADAEHKLYEAEKLAWSVAMARKADALVKETGIDSKELESCQTEEEMEVKALRFQLSNKEPEETPKFDPLVGQGVGTDLDGMSPREKIDAGIAKLKKK